ncbi:MAG: 6-phosphogluconolactonase [Cytophagaceae bacterium SCN 52-12]|nr:MAG: 6-phosphogluconolactonase [Cytophagaceae bacterium SCN 52-12]
MKYAWIMMGFGLLASCAAPQESAIRFMIGSTDRSDSSGVHFATLNPETGEIAFKGFTATAPSPGYIAFSSDKKALFVVTGDNKISSYGFADGELTFINSQPAEGLNPCHVSVHPSGEMAFLANYSDGSFSAYGIEEGFRLTPAVYTEKYEGSGPNEGRQKSPHAHCAVVTPNGKYVYVTDLGTDKVMNYVIDASDRKTEPNAAQPFFSVKPGAGPRHLAVHPDGKWLYLINELDATVTAASIAENGSLTELATYPTLPAGYAEPGNTSAAIRLHPNGKFVYVSNRGYDAVHGFRIEADGTLTKVNEVREKIAAPRDFNLDPSGKFMVVGNQKTNDLTLLTVDPETGVLTYKSTSGNIAGPSCFEFF